MGWLSGACEPGDDHEVMVVLDDAEPMGSTGERASLLRELAAQSGGKLVEIAPGWWYESKLPPAGHQRGEMPSDRG